MKVRDLFDLRDRVAIITGGSIGLGRQMAEALAEAGANVVLAARKVERCEEAAREIAREYGTKAIPFRCDVANPDEVRALVEGTVGEFGRIDILVNNAGITWGAPAGEYPLEKWEKVMAVNVTGSFLAAREVFPVMRSQGRGKIINIASLAGFVGVRPELMDAVAYNVSKGATVAMTRDLAVKWARYGICVNAIAPGWFPTHMSEWVIEHRKEGLLEYIPLGRFGNEDDLKGAVVYLASAASDYVTGHVLCVDGGWLVN